MSSPRSSTVEVTQRYFFADRRRGDRCEPSRKVACARFWPHVTWTATRDVPANTTVTRVRIIQRFDLKPDNRPLGTSAILRDKVHRGKNPGVKTLHMARETKALAIAHGKKQSKKGEWDNYHQTGGSMVALPGVLGSAGCPECVHFHWGWTTAVNARFRTHFTDGRPAVEKDSNQTATIAVVAEHGNETDPVDNGYERLLSGEELARSHPIMYWDSSSPGIERGAGTTGDSTFPILLDDLPGDRGSMWFAPAAPSDDRGPRCGGKLIVKWPKQVPYQAMPLDRRLPAGYVLPVHVAVACGRSRGPFYVKVKGATLLNAESAFEQAPFGSSYIEVRDDKYARKGAGGTGTFTPGNRFTTKRGTLTTYLVFREVPVRKSIHLTLVSAP